LHLSDCSIVILRFPVILKFSVRLFGWLLFHDTNWYSYSSFGRAPSCALSDTARIILADDWAQMIIL